ncbi:asparaginase [Pseudonocardia kunmingensis]|uniref:L-asparaginase n=1 Tax=Pseudonocardia kunmingensis TaxID=630975 RepID=A0A543DIA6_9PSEU|nr:asparaginase [Pseudonocardia kunmingensis]TQM09051.1 L-asparaginase [Pseudonocardia kunmingensis]
MKVAVLAMGGTIASAGTGGVTPRLSPDDLVAAVPQLRDVAAIETASFRQVPSGDLTLTDVAELAVEIGRRLAGGADGIVVTQGTDTIEETAFALDLLLPGPQPVVVTGAMRNPTLPGADGPANLLAAVQVAACPQASRMGVLVVANDEVHAARFVRKTATASPATFRSGTVGPVGWLVEGRPHIAFRVPSLGIGELPVPGPIPPVALLTSVIGDDARLVPELERLGYAGLVIAGFGGGHVPGAVAPVLAESATHIPVVLASRAGSGELLRTTYGFPGAERDLLASGLISAEFLDAPKARVLLSLILAGGAEPGEVRAVFEKVGASGSGPTSPRRGSSIG